MVLTSKEPIPLSGGIYGRTNEVLEYGQSFDDAIYVGANFNYDKLRDHSESYLQTFYSDLRYRPNEDTELFVNMGQAY